VPNQTVLMVGNKATKLSERALSLPSIVAGMPMDGKTVISKLALQENRKLIGVTTKNPETPDSFVSGLERSCPIRRE
jgi:hypothetical protein